MGYSFQAHRINGGINADEKYWEYLEDGQFRLPRCSGCARWVWPAHFRCGECGSWELEWVEQDPAGSVFTYRPGSPAAICIPPGADTKIMYVGDLYPGRIYKLTLDGEVLGWLGKSGKPAGQFGGLHGLACPSENVLYTAEFINWRSQKLILHPERAATTRTGRR